MPLYEYECDACHHRFEVIQRFSDPLVEVCPKCGGHVHKLMSSPAIQFKGSGFYITDYAKKDHVAAAKADTAEGAKAEKSEKSERSEKSEKSDKGESSTSASDKTAPAAKAEKSPSRTSTSSESTPASTATKDTGKS